MHTISGMDTHYAKNALLLNAGKKKKISHRQLGLLFGSSSPFSPLSRWGLNPIMLVCDPDQLDGRLSLTASAFNQLGQYTNSPGCRGYCYAELAVFFPSGGRNHCQYSLRLPTEGWPGWVELGGWLHNETVYLPEGSHPVLTGLNVEQLHWSRSNHNSYTKLPPREYQVSSS